MVELERRLMLGKATQPTTPTGLGHKGALDLPPPLRHRGDAAPDTSKTAV